MDRVVSAVQFEDTVLIFTERGFVYTLIRDRSTGAVQIQLTTEIKLYTK